ncbi:MAG TPA: acyl-ACP--UDP-N-acetylglucosamine O-acyltransferase [Chthoniobacteraceae bacterium]|jgi:UDP-N-acetylglucosamine acyltransferase|nr:acyl-ACP--UDP-N-acetylglucosamine O-acyltransferase [Phycisphaerae bacterium]HWB59727.1 acyl-ACP--UDP-N-acetylglucosamine O-acyltransferase [Chthoniobacteraceae bacterium]
MIHPTAVISREASLAPDVQVGPYAVLEGPVKLGAGCMIHAHATLRGPITMGARNAVHPHAVIGDWPQDRKFRGEESEVVVGDDNIFREGSTIHRPTGTGSRTTIGSRCFFMVNSHVGHNCTVADDVTIVNGGALGGHVQVGERAIIGSYCAIHQFCRVGRLTMLSNAANFNVDVPPFFISMITNTVTQLNAVGLRRSGMARESINALREMLRLAFRTSNRPLAAALADLPPEIREIPEVREVIEFVRTTKRGVSRFAPWSDRGGGVLLSEE